MHITLDIVEFEDDDKAPMFDLIIGTETMQRLGFVLDFKTKLITIDEIILPMKRLKNLQSGHALTNEQSQGRLLSVVTSLSQYLLSSTSTSTSTIQLFIIYHIITCKPPLHYCPSSAILICRPIITGISNPIKSSHHIVIIAVLVQSLTELLYIYHHKSIRL